MKHSRSDSFSLPTGNTVPQDARYSRWESVEGNNLPTVDVGTGAKELPEVTSKSAIILIPIVLLFACCVYIKKTYHGGVAFSRVDWMIGLVIALLFFPVHEQSYMQLAEQHLKLGMEAY